MNERDKEIEIRQDVGPEINAIMPTLHLCLYIQRCWDVALGPLKQIPMNLFIMYMSGNTISIFPIMMVCMMAWRPIQALMSMSASEYHLMFIICFSPLMEAVGVFELFISSQDNFCIFGPFIYFCFLLPQPSSCWKAPVSSGSRVLST